MSLLGQMLYLRFHQLVFQQPQWEKTTGFLDLNEQRLYDSDRYQEFSYDISSSININDWKNPLKFAAHPAGFKVVGTQVLSQGSTKEFRSKPSLNLNAGNTFDWWVSNTNSLGTTFNGTTFVSFLNHLLEQLVKSLLSLTGL